MAELYVLDMTVNACHVVGLVNGFPIFDLATEQAVNFAPPINPFLVDGDNTVLVQIAPLEQPDEQVAAPSEILAAGSIRRYQPGDTAEPGGGELVVPLGEPHARMAGGWQQSLPFGFNVSFRCTAESFRDRLLEAPVLAEPARAIHYALLLRELFRAQNVGILAQHFMPKLLDYVRAFGSDPARMGDELKTFLEDIVFPTGLELEYDVPDVVLRPWCGGRVWELSRQGGRPLIYTREDAEGGRYKIPIYAGLVDGELRVVR